MKDALIYCSGSREDDLRLALGLDFVANYGTAVEVVLATETPEVQIAMGGIGGMAPPVHDIAYDEVLKRGTQIKNNLQTTLTSKIPGVQIEERIGSALLIAQDIASQSNLFDLFLTTLPTEDDSLGSTIMDEVLANGGAGTLAVPIGYTGRGHFKNITIAWSASKETSRAVSMAMPLLKLASSVEVLLIDQPLRTAGEIRKPGDGIVSHLRRHGVNSELSRVTSGSLKTFEAILAEVSRTNSDLLVLGARTHGGLLQWFKESVSRELMRESSIPLYMAG